jgi:glycosyltransferase involved in cell wall biosynthesis
MDSGVRNPARILMTTDAVGGVWQYSLELARGLSRRGVAVVLAVLGPAANRQQEDAARAIPGLTLVSHEGRLEWMEDPFDHVDAAGAWLMDLVDRGGIDLVHLNGYSHGALRFGRTVTVPALVVAHSCVFSWWSAVKGAGGSATPPPAWDAYHRRVSAGLHGADHVVAPTAAMLASVEQHYGRLRSASVIYNGRDPLDWAFEGRKSDYVLSVGRLWDEAKNTAALGRIAGDLAWPIRVAGAATMPTSAEAASSPKNVLSHLVWLGPLSPRALAAQYACASIYALPALYEPFGLSALEAALARCALVLGDIPSLRELWSDAAVFVNPRDDGALLHVLSALIEDPARRKTLSQRAFVRATSYAAEAMVRGYLELYRGLLGAAGRREALACVS